MRAGRRHSLPASLPSLKRRLEEDYGFRVQLRYEDADGDLITLGTQNDYNEMLLSETGTVNVSCRGLRECVGAGRALTLLPAALPRARRCTSPP